MLWNIIWFSWQCINFIEGDIELSNGYNIPVCFIFYIPLCNTSYIILYHTLDTYGTYATTVALYMIIHIME